MNNKTISHHKEKSNITNVISIPVHVQDSEKVILYKMMMGKIVNNDSIMFIDNRNEWIAKYIYSFRESWYCCGITTDNFICYLSCCKILESCGGAEYIKSVFGSFADYDGVIP